MEYIDELRAFDSDIADIVQLLEDDDVPAARTLFNEHIEPRYEPLIGHDASTAIVAFWIELKEFFNNQQAVDAGVASKAGIVDYYRTTFPGDLKLLVSRSRS